MPSSSRNALGGFPQFPPLILVQRGKEGVDAIKANSSTSNFARQVNQSSPRKVAGSHSCALDIEL